MPVLGYITEACPGGEGTKHKLVQGDTYKSVPGKGGGGGGGGGDG